MDKADPEKKIGLMVDEWGTWYDPAPGSNPAFLVQDNTLRDALVAATNFHIFQRHADRVRMAAIAQMVNVLQSMIRTDGPKMLLTPTYYAFLMYQPFQGRVGAAGHHQLTGLRGRHKQDAGGRRDRRQIG